MALLRKICNGGASAFEKHQSVDHCPTSNPMLEDQGSSQANSLTKATSDTSEAAQQQLLNIETLPPELLLLVNDHLSRAGAASLALTSH